MVYLLTFFLMKISTKTPSPKKMCFVLLREKEKIYKPSQKRLVDILGLPSKLHFSSPITLTRLAVGFGP